MDWMLIAKLAGLILLIIVICWTPAAMAYWSLFRSRGNQQRARVLSDGRIEFFPDQFSLWIRGLIAVGAPVEGVRLLIRHHATPLDFLVGGTFVLGAIAVTFEIPGAIVVSNADVEQRYWLRQNKRIAWKEVVEINTGRKIKEIVITGSDGTRIVHSGAVADRPRLLLELKQHCGNDLPLDFPRE